MIPAYGVGGVERRAVSSGARRGRRPGASPARRGEWDASYDGYVAAGEETDDELFGDDGGEHVLHQFAFALHGGLHRVALAPDIDPALLRASVGSTHRQLGVDQLAEMGGHAWAGAWCSGGETRRWTPP